MKNLVVTTIGKDRPGIVAGFSTLLANCSANILKTRASALGDLFVMVMLVDISHANITLAELISKLKEKGVELGSGVAVEEPEAFQRERKLVAFDLDGTLIDTEIINELAKIKGVEREVADITRRALEGEVNFREALVQRVRLLKGLRMKDLEVLRKAIKVLPGAQDLIRELKKLGFATAIITGSFGFFAEDVGRKLGVDYVYSNKLLIDGGRLTGEFTGEIVDAESKLRVLREIAAKEKISLDECVAVGDGANDLLIIKNSGLGVGVNPKRLVKEEADAIIDVKSLTALPAIIGFGPVKNDVIRRLKCR
ncbi:MAG: phosphoserine phosphatase SerB [Candidatus Bathyarchaeia archaeon]